MWAEIWELVFSDNPADADPHTLNPEHIDPSVREKIRSILTPSTR